MRPDNAAKPAPHVCPWWLIWTFDNPLRRLVQNPERVLQGLVRPGDACLDLGCGIGYFTIPLARLVGPTGSVTAVDLQPRMLGGVRRRALRAGLLPRIHLLQSDASSLQLNSAFDFTLAFWMLHEVPDATSVLRFVAATLRPAAHFLLAEPRGHVRRRAFDQSVRSARAVGLETVGEHPVPLSHAVLMVQRGRRTAGADCAIPALLDSMRLSERPVH